jgi:uncharacterized protein
VVLIDVNVLVYAHRKDAPGHAEYLRWLEKTASSDAAFGLSELVLSGFLRVVTNPKIFNPPSSLERALRFANELRGQPNCTIVSTGPRHWDLFTRLSMAVKAKGNLIPDAYLAALAIETGSEWITADRDYSRFPGLRWRHPLESPAAFRV